MAEDKSKKKGKSKKGKPEPRNWTKIGLQVLIVAIMVMSVLAFTLNVNRGGNSNNEASSNERSFNGMAEALKLVPANASFARYADLRNDSALADSFEKYYWMFGNTVPPESVFNAKPQRDLFAVYSQGYFGNFTEQYVSLTDFGTARINLSYPDYSYVQGVKRVNSKYYYTYETKPVISGRIENVVPVANVMFGGNESSYEYYAGIFDEMKWKQISVDDMTMEVVGKSCNLSYSDGYYAAVRPVDPGNKSSDRPYDYKVVMRLNQTMPDKDFEDLALYGDAMEKMGFASYRPQYYDDYVIIEARGSLDSCLGDMFYRWGFIKYQPSL